jgi:peptidoglycan/LPS O-acetylase OafA/YrhL
VKIDFRSDIQVLRALAIIAVVGYHMGIPGFNNGFFGVDIFFVLSGYLMAQVYTKGKTKQFFIRRARRLLPAYFATIFSTLIIGFLLIAPSDFRQVHKQSLFSMGFLPNFYFWSQDSYFSNSNFNPLLHLWSLGVEFQFYLFVPLIILCLRNRIVLYTTLIICTIILSFIVLSISPKTSFFMFPLRSWEFLLGMLLLYSEKRFVILNSGKKKVWIGIPLVASGFLLAGREAWVWGVLPHPSVVVVVVVVLVVVGRGGGGVVVVVVVVAVVVVVVAVVVVVVVIAY